MKFIKFNVVRNRQFVTLTPRTVIYLFIYRPHGLLSTYLYTDPHILLSTYLYTDTTYCYLPIYILTPTDCYLPIDTLTPRTVVYLFIYWPRHTFIYLSIHWPHLLLSTHLYTDPTYCYALTPLTVSTRSLTTLALVVVGSLHPSSHSYQCRGSDGQSRAQDAARCQHPLATATTARRPHSWTRREHGPTWCNMDEALKWEVVAVHQMRDTPMVQISPHCLSLSQGAPFSLSPAWLGARQQASRWRGCGDSAAVTRVSACSATSSRHAAEGGLWSRDSTPHWLLCSVCKTCKCCADDP